MNIWDENNSGIDINQLQGRECYAGLDLSSTQDLTALVLVFPEENLLVAPLWYFDHKVCPERPGPTES